MNLLTNAVESIQVGVEDYSKGSRPRLLSAVRNIHAGILLLYKEALRRRSPPDSNEVWVKAKVQKGPDGREVGVGKKTAEVWQIRDRFEDLGIATDWRLLAGITEVRNEVEHYFPNITQDAIGGVVASALLLLRDFSLRELGEEPRELLGETTWRLMLSVATVHQTEKAECAAALSNIDWRSKTLETCISSLRCTNCGSDLLRPSDGGTDHLDTELHCRACGTSIPPIEFVPQAIAVGLSWEVYLSWTDGNHEPVVACPDCRLATFVLDESRCVYCRAVKHRDCMLCGSEIPSSEFTSHPLCGYCDHMTSKSD